MNIASAAMGAATSGAGDGMGVLSQWKKSDTISSLQGGASALGMLGAIGGGYAKAANYKEQASDAILQGQQAGVTGQQTQTGLKQQLLSTLAGRTAAYGASGVDAGSGVAADTRTALTGEAVQAGNLAGDQTAIAQSRQQINALNYRRMAQQATSAGWIDGIAKMFTGGMSILNAG